MNVKDLQTGLVHAGTADGDARCDEPLNLGRKGTDEPAGCRECIGLVAEDKFDAMNADYAVLRSKVVECRIALAKLVKSRLANPRGEANRDDHYRMLGIFDCFLTKHETKRGGCGTCGRPTIVSIQSRLCSCALPVQNTSELRAEPVGEWNPKMTVGVDLADGPDLTGVFIPAASQVKEQVLGLAVWCLHCDDEFPPGRNLVHNCPDRPERHGSSFTSHAEHRKKKSTRPIK